MYPLIFRLNFSKTWNLRSRNGVRKMGFWQRLESGPPDATLEMYKMYVRDQSKEKIDLTIDQYRDDDNKSHVFDSVRKAETAIFSKRLDHEYLPIEGDPELCSRAVALVLGENHEALKAERVAVAQSLSGTGGLRIAAEYLIRFHQGCKRVYVSRPTWDNHPLIFKHAFLDVKKYPYHKRGDKSIDFSNFISFLKGDIPSSSIILLQGNAHYPTGFDPTPEQWKEISSVCKSRRIFPVFHLDCLGFASGSVTEDAFPIHQFITDGHEICVAQSFSTNMGLYGNRLGVVWFLVHSKDTAEKVLSQLKICVRILYSNPPLHPARIGLGVLKNSNLRNEWLQELKCVSDRIYCIRKRLVELLVKKGSKCDWKYLVEQNGMPSALAITEKQALLLRKNHHIYLPQSGYISFAGVNSKNVEYLANALHAVTK